jgi:ribose-phosphate pyrophosphokinase
MIDADFAIMHKTRPAHDEVSVTEIAGRVRDKVAIVGDDVIMTGGTLLANVAALKEHGVKDVWVFATHGLFSHGALDRFGARLGSPASSSRTRCPSIRRRVRRR